MIALFLRFFSTKIYQYIALTLSAGLMLLSIRRSGAVAEKNKNLETNMKATQKVSEVQNAVDIMSDADINKRLREKYSRD